MKRESRRGCIYILAPAGSLLTMDAVEYCNLGGGLKEVPAGMSQQGGCLTRPLGSL